MTPKDPEIREHVDVKGERIFSAAIYRRLSSLTEGWAQEERAKTKVAVQSLLWFVCVIPAAAGLGWLMGGNLFASLFLGCMFWVVVVFALMHDHLSAKPK